MRRTGLVLLVVLSALLAGCGEAPVVGGIIAGAPPSAPPSAVSSAPPSAPPSASPVAEGREGRVLTPEEARSVLPDVKDMPGEGWDSPPSTEDSTPPTNPAECLQVARRGPADQAAEPTVLETVIYSTKSPSYVNAKFVVASWPNAADGLDVDKAAALAKRCQKFTASAGGKEFPISVDPVKALPIGEKQFAVKLTVVGDDYLTVLWCRLGHNLIQLSVIHRKANLDLATLQPVLESIVKELAAP